MDAVLCSVVDALRAPVVVIAENEHILHVNPAGRRIVGPSMVGRHFITALRQPALLDAVEAVLRGQSARDARFLTRKGGQDISYQVHCAPVQRDTGRGAALLVFDDVSDIATAGQMRRDFVANVSHELRTPLTAMMGFIETILHGPAREDPVTRDRFLSIMEAEAARMNRLVGDLLSLGRVEASERVRPTDPVDLVALIRSVAHGLQPLADDTNLNVELDMPDMGVTVPGDEDQLRQVVTNLAENAIKYGGDGDRIRITLGPPRFHPGVRAEAVVLSVRDFGAGFDPVHIPRLTERFYRVDTHRSREMGGTGLGLAIVKHIINRHRGRIQIDTTPGQGAEFRIVLPTQSDAS